MRQWTREQTFSIVQRAIQDTASGGGCIQSDNHREIPLQVRDSVLSAIYEAAKEYGRYLVSV